MHSKLLCDVVIIFVHVPPGGIKSARVVKQKHTEGAGGKQAHAARQKKRKINSLSRFSAHVWKRAGKKEDVSLSILYNDFIKNTKSAARKSSSIYL
jgi:hypothetical protein